MADLAPADPPAVPPADPMCAEDGCGHYRSEHNGQGGRCTVGRQKDTAAWRCDCRGFVDPEPELEADRA